MIILPAIDIKDGRCVRLYQGDFSTALEVAEDPLQTALGFYDCGASWIHLVDLDGSLKARSVNAHIFTGIAAKTGLLTEVGGGIRDMKTIEFYIENGISRVILGTAAIEDRALLKEALRTYGDKIAVGIDARDEKAASCGWTKDSGIHFIDMAKRMQDMGVRFLIYTDISRDGTLNGANTDHYRRLKEAVSCDIIASGGIRNIEDIKGLQELGLYGAICGKSIYSGTLNLKEALSMTSQSVRKDDTDN